MFYISTDTVVRALAWLTIPPTVAALTAYLLAMPYARRVWHLVAGAIVGIVAATSMCFMSEIARNLAIPAILIAGMAVGFGVTAWLARWRDFD